MLWNDSKWVYQRTRTDKKDFGNALKTARNIVCSSLNSIDIDLLCYGVKQQYFEKKRSKLYDNMSEYMNKVKRQ